MIELVRIDDRELYKVNDFISQDNVLFSTFGQAYFLRKRLLDSCYAAYIMIDDKKIGFINIVDRFNNLEIDMGILSFYRGKGYGTKALKILKEQVIKDRNNIIIQTKRSNIAAIKSIDSNGFKLIKEDNHYKYYTV